MIYEAWKKIGGTVPFGQLELFHHHADVKRIDESIRSRIKEEAESALKTPWPRLTASLYRDFRLNGNRANFENLGFERIRILSTLFWGEYIEYEIWTMQSSYHNLPEINGSMQRFGEEYRALEARFVPADGPEGDDRFSLGLSRAYGEDASVNRWHREMTFNRKEKAVKWKESFAFRKRQSFQMHLMTPWKPLKADPGPGPDLGGRLILFNGPGGWSQAALAARPCSRGWSQAALGGRGQSDESLDNPFDEPFYGVDKPTELICTYPAELSVEIEEIILEDEKLLAVWPQRIYRVVFGGTAREGELHFTLRAGTE